MKRKSPINKKQNLILSFLIASIIFPASCSQNAKQGKQTEPKDTITAEETIEPESTIKEMYYSYPTEENMDEGDWAAFKEVLPVPYMTKGDFDNNGIIDEAWILIAQNSQDIRCALCVILNKSDSIILEEYRSTYCSLNITTVEKGTYKTACGKGYWDCKEGEPPQITVPHSAIRISPYQKGGETFFVWNKQTKSFNLYIMSD